LGNPPGGKDPMAHLQGPFSVIQFDNSFGPETLYALGWLAFQMKLKLGVVVDSVIAKWLQESLLAPVPKAIPMMLYVALPIASSLNESGATELLGTCQSLLLYMWSLIEFDDKIGDYLAQALNYMADLVQRENHPIAQWRTEGGKKAMEIIIKKFSRMFIIFSQSTHPDVRASIARIIHNLSKWKELQPELKQVLEKLAKDNRARVRYAATIKA
jgi:hypothetical protein